MVSAMGAAALGSGLSSLYSAYKTSQIDAPSRPSPPRKTRTEIRPGVYKVRTREQTDDGVVINEDIERSPEQQEEYRQREQMIDELWDTVGTTDDERNQQFEDAKQAYLDSFKENVKPQFEEQRDQQQANQVATGRSIGTVGALARGDLRESQNDRIAQEEREAEMMARDLQAQEDQRNLQLIQQLESGMSRRQAEAARASGNLSNMVSAERARNNAQFQADKAAMNNEFRQVQNFNNIARTGAAFGGYFADRYNNSAGGGGPDFSSLDSSSKYEAQVPEVGALLNGQR